MDFFEPPTNRFNRGERYPLFTSIGLLRRAARTSSRPSANRTRFRIASAGGVLSMPARAATSDAVSSSNEKCFDSIMGLQRLLDLNQSRIQGLSSVLLVCLDSSLDDLL